VPTAFLAALVLTACSDNAATNQSAKATTPTIVAAPSQSITSTARTPPADDDEGTPACSQVWVSGQTLPKNYNGCTNRKMFVAPVTHECTDGSSLTTYDDKFYALLGGPISKAQTEIADDPAYKRVLNSC